MRPPAGLPGTATGPPAQRGRISINRVRVPRGDRRADSRERKGSIMKIQTEQGEITISSEVFTNITGAAATNCYGVKGMAVRSKTDGLVHLLRRESMGKGVKVTYNEDSSVSIELHIIVDNGVNLMAVSRSIMSEVRYIVHRTTGAEVRNVDVCIDSMVIG